MANLDAVVAIIGAGPIGLELALALKRAEVDYIQFDAKQIGYTISWFPPQTRFFSSNERIAIAGNPVMTDDQGKCTREHYLGYLRGIVQQFGLRVRTYEPIVNIQQEGDQFVLTSRPNSGEQTYRVQKLVLATGGTDHPRVLNVPGENLPHVSHYFTDPHQYFGRKVLIVGGKNSAVESALRCYQAGASVSFSYRRSGLRERSIKYWLLPEINGYFKSGAITPYFSTCVKEILPDRVLLTDGISLECGTTAREVQADFVLLLIGYEADMTLCRLAGVELIGSGQIPRFDPLTMQTNVPGVYVAGTAVGGTQDKYEVFIENCHVHVDRIVASLTGAPPPEAPAPFERPES